MRFIRSSMASLFLLPLVACNPVKPAATTPTVTSDRGYRIDESMTHAGTFRLTVTLVSHLSNAIMLTIQTENISGSTADWSPGEAVSQAYLLDGGTRLSLRQASGIFGRATSLEPGSAESGQLIFPLPGGETFQFHYPDCQPPSITLDTP